MRDSSKQDTRDVGADLEMANDGRIKYVEVNCLRCNEDKAFNNAVKYNVPVVILDLDGYGALNDGDLQMLNSFVGVKYVIVAHAADPTILSSAYNEITSTFSDIEVYLQSYDERGDKIFEKYQP